MDLLTSTTSTFHPGRTLPHLPSPPNKSGNGSIYRSASNATSAPNFTAPTTTAAATNSNVPFDQPGPIIYSNIHDGFATVRKRKGPSRASIAIRQEQDCYDLATSSPSLNRHSYNGSSGGDIGSFKSNSTHFHKNGSGSNGRRTSSGNGHSPPLKSPPLPNGHVPECGKVGGGIGTLGRSNSEYNGRGGKGSPSNSNPCGCSLLGPTGRGSSNENGSGIGHVLNQPGPPRLKSSSSLSRKLRRLVLPNKLHPPPSSTSSHLLNNAANGHGHGSFHHNGLRGSVSDNSIASCCRTGNIYGGEGGGSGTDFNPLHQVNGGYPRQQFHRSCFLPKPPLEPVMEDGIPWRPRKDVPWWELATRKHRYRSCPILQVSQQAHVVAAFEQSLSNMTQRLQALTVTAEQKDTELLELRQTIEFLRKQSIEAGLTVTNLTGGASRDGSPIARQLSADSVSSINSISSACSGTSHSHTSSPSGQVHMTPLGTPTHSSQVAPDSPNSKKKHSKNKGWLRSSFTKAFSRSKVNKPRNGSLGDQNYEDSLRRPSNLNGDTFGHNGHGNGRNLKQLENSAPASPLLASPHGGHSSGHSNGCGSSSGSHSPHSNGNVKGSSSKDFAICDENELKNKSVDDMKKQLREKEMVLTDIRLEALTSAHQLESLKETVTKMRNEMQNLKQDNERLQRLVTCKSLTSSQTSLQTSGLDSLDRRLSSTEIPAPSSIDILLADPSEKEGKRIVVTVFLGCHGSYERYVNTGEGFSASECAVGTVAVSSRTKWDLLDSLVKRTFKDYVMRVDPVTNLGLSADSILSYNVGEVLRSKEGQLPELLPCGYLVGDVNKIRICLKGALQNGCVDALAFETLIPKSIVQRYVTWLSDHGRMILCGPSGTGKSYLARKLGEFFVARSGKDPSPEAIATFSADHKNNKELRQYLSNLAEQCESSVDLPSVIILDNLHQVSSFGEVFNGFLHSRQSSAPLFIGTMSQSMGSTANLQLHHNFRWVLFGNNVEPVKGLLSRFLRRRIIEVDVQSGGNSELTRVFDWIPEVWLHINKFLERHNSADVSIGPRLFLSCPTDVANSQVWFTDLWHYSIVPYVIEAVKEGLQLYGKKVPWEDPAQFLLQTYPWSESLSLSTTKSSLLRLRPEDVGYDIKSGPPVPASKTNKSGTDQDPLMNMLMRLQEAANYSGPQSNESDTTSLDSRASLDSKDFIATA